MSDFEDFDDTPMPAEGRPFPKEQSGWARTLAWVILILGGVYMLNPTLGLDILPDNLPLIGNLDEAAVLLLMLGALRSLGIYLPEFVERWIQPTSRLPPPSERE